MPVLERTFQKRKAAVGTNWRMDETYIKVGGEWKYLYRAVDKAGNTVDFRLTAKRDRTAAQRFLTGAIGNNALPTTITIERLEAHARPRRRQTGRTHVVGYGGKTASRPLTARASGGMPA
jgi:transposase-like protein